MKLLILKNNLKTSLSIIERAIGKNINLPILENVLLETQKNFLLLITTDLEIAIRCWVLAKIETPGVVAVPAKFLSNFINSLIIDKISLKKEGNFLLVENETLKAKIKTDNPDDFPLFPTFDKTNSIQINTAPFIEGLKQVVEITSPSQIKPELSGVFFQLYPEDIKLVATDSWRLAEKTLFFEKKENKETSFIVPHKTIRELINILTDKKEKLTLYFSKNQVVFEFFTEDVTQPRIQVFSRLIEGDFPNYQESIPKKYTTQISFSRLPFLNQIKTAGLFCGKINEIKLKIQPKQKLIEISAQNPDLGENKTSFPIEVQGEEIEVAFNWRFLVDGLSNIKSQEVTFELNGDEGPAVLRPVGDQSYFYILMPIKTT